MRPLTTRVRLALGHVIALGLALALFTAILFFLFRAQAYSQLDRALRSDLEHADDRIDGLVAGTSADGSTRRDNWITEIWSGAGQRVYASDFPDRLALGPWDPGCLKSGHPFTITTPEGLKARVFCQESSMERGRYVLRVARLSETVEARLADFLKTIAAAIPLVLLFSLWMGSLLARQALAPLERSLIQMRRFTSDASHELRTPLTAIRALGEVALNSRPGESDHREVLSNVLEETDRLRGLCDALLLLSRADAGQVELHPALVSAEALLSDAHSLVAVLAEEKEQRITVNVDRSLICRVDPTLFKQALINLIDNAIKYSPAGTEIRLSAERKGDDALFQVSDQGPGIAREHQALVYERFYRIEASRSRQAGGAGLGLSIVKWIAELHQGTVSMSSAPPRGSNFAIQVPAEKPVKKMGEAKS